MSCPFCWGFSCCRTLPRLLVLLPFKFSVLGIRLSVDSSARSPWFSNPKPTTDNLFLCLARDLLLVRNSALTRTFAGARIGVRALSTDRQAATVTKSTVRSDFDQPLDMHRDVFAEIAFDSAFALDDLADAIDFIFTEVLNLLGGLDGSGLQDLVR